MKTSHHPRFASVREEAANMKLRSNLI